MSDSAQLVAQPVAAPQRAKEKSGRRHLRTTREGKAFIFVTLGVGFAAFNTGNNLLFLILGFMLSLIVLSGIMSETVIRQVRVSRRLPERAFAGSTCLIELVLENRKLRSPSYSLEVEDLAEGLPTERRCYFLKIAPGSEQVASYRRTPNRRGRLKLKGFRLATRYPFGIFETWRMLEGPGELLVFPRLLPDTMAELDARSSGNDAPTTKVGPGNEIGGLRTYQLGDDARAIHWMRTASLGRIVVFERHSDAATQLTIRLDNGCPQDADPAWDAGFEEAISRVASIAMTNSGRDLSMEVVCRGSRSALVMPGSPADPLLSFLALLQSVSGPAYPAFAPHSRNARLMEVRVKPITQEAS